MGCLMTMVLIAIPQIGFSLPSRCEEALRIVDPLSVYSVEKIGPIGGTPAQFRELAFE